MLYFQKFNGTVTLTLREVSDPGLRGAFAIDPVSLNGAGAIGITPLRSDVMDRERYPTDLRLEVAILIFPLVSFLRFTDVSSRCLQPIASPVRPHRCQSRFAYWTLTIIHLSSERPRTISRCPMTPKTTIMLELLRYTLVPFHYLQPQTAIRLGYGS